MIMIAWIDTPAGRRASAGRGAMVVLVGLSLCTIGGFSQNLLNFAGIALAALGLVLIVLAFAHPTCSGRPLRLSKPCKSERHDQCLGSTEGYCGCTCHLICLDSDIVYPVEIFISYSHVPEDSRLVFKLVDYLESKFSKINRYVLIHDRHPVRIDCDRRVTTGTDWQDRFNEDLFQDANYILLAISPDYLASKYCRGQMDSMALREQASSVKVIPIILRPIEQQPKCPWKLLPANGQPVVDWPRREEAFEEIAEAIIQVIPPELQKYVG